MYTTLLCRLRGFLIAFTSGSILNHVCWYQSRNTLHKVATDQPIHLLTFHLELVLLNESPDKAKDPPQVTLEEILAPYT